MVYEEHDGFIGSITGSNFTWEWTTDLKGLRIAQQLEGTSSSLKLAQEDFKAAYERFRSHISDEEFDRVYRRGPPRSIEEGA